MSGTALGDAFIRASHVELSPQPLIDDPVSGRLLTAQERAAFTASVLTSARNQDAATGDTRATVRHWLDRLSAAAPHVVLRTRFVAEEITAAAIAQYVILAAGLDVFAVRPAVAYRGVAPAVLEIDLPAAQEAKRARLARAGIATPALHRPCDLETGDLAGQLSGAGLDPRAPTAASLAGVSYYLSRAAIAATLHALRTTFGPGLIVVADYWDTAHVPGDRAVRSMFASVARNDEPFRTWFTPAQWRHLCDGAGFTVELDLSAPEYLAMTAPSAPGPQARPIGRFTRMRSR